VVLREAAEGKPEVGSDSQDALLETQYMAQGSKSDHSYAKIKLRGVGKRLVLGRFLKIDPEENSWSNMDQIWVRKTSSAVSAYNRRKEGRRSERLRPL